MAIYTYKGIDKAGKKVKGTMNADGPVMAKQRARAMSIMLIEIKEQKSDASKNISSVSFGKVVSTTDLALLTRQLATLVKAKIQIVDALSAIMDQTDNGKLKIILSEIRAKVNEGSSLANALGDYPNTFDNIFCNMVDAGESSGTLEVVLLRLADFTESQQKLKTKVKGAMTYPVIMTVFGSIMMGIIFIFVIPKITKIFVSMKRELPLQTKISIFISDFLQNYWWAVIIGVFASWYLFKKYISSTSGKSRWDALVLKLPVAGNLVTMINISRFSSTLATLLNSGVPILASMKIVKNLIGNVHIQEAVQKARDAIQEGGQMTKPLADSKLFPPMVIHMLRLGERSGELEPMLKIVAENYEDQVNAKLNGLTSILEPIMMIVMGVAVAFIVFSVVVPMMELNKV
jgi:general secretion pathway protein F